MKHLQSIAILAAVGFGVYLISKLKPVGEAANTALDATASTIANAITAVTGGTSPRLTMGVVLPSGERVDFHDVLAEGSGLDENFEFNWRGVRYRVTGRRPDNDYNAVLVRY